MTCASAHGISISLLFEVLDACWLWDLYVVLFSTSNSGTLDDSFGREPPREGRRRLRPECLALASPLCLACPSSMPSASSTVYRRDVLLILSA